MQSIVCACSLSEHCYMHMFCCNADAFMVQLDQDEQAVAKANMFTDVSISVYCVIL